MKIVYKITYPNGKIYIGSDLTNNINYFGSASAKLVVADFSDKDRLDFTIRREVLLASEDLTDREIRSREIVFIKKLRSNDPSIGYNRNPKFNEESNA